LKRLDTLVSFFASSRDTLPSLSVSRRFMLDMLPPLPLVLLLALELVPPLLADAPLEDFSAAWMDKGIANAAATAAAMRVLVSMVVVPFRWK
jgi:hypothetical protein